MSHYQEPYQTQDEEIGLPELFKMLWQGRWIIIFVTLAFSASGVFIALSKPNIYKASAILTAANWDGTEGGLSGISGQIGGLANLAGLSIGGDASNQTVIAKEILQSRAFLTDFIWRHDLMIPLMATEAWNSMTEEWVINREIYDPDGDAWLRDDGGKSLKPTNWDMVKKFREKHLRVSTNDKTGLVTLSVASESPYAAKEWVEKLVHDINEYMRRQDVSEANARIAFIEDKLKETNIAEMQKMFYQIIESEIRTVMLANAHKEYVFKIIDPAVVPQEKSEPKRALIVGFASVLGVGVGVFTIFLLTLFKSLKKDQPKNKNDIV